MNSMNTIGNVYDRNELINDIRYQASLWNSIQMHDGSGTLIYFYEVGVGENSRPGKINGKKVIEILREDGDYAGEFSTLSLKIRIDYLKRHVDTPLHEMGHVLGLNDLDDESGISSGTHKTIMGYSRGTTRRTIDDAIKYQDIQGVAVLNNIHTEHQYNRYVIKDNKYLNICFYCDKIDSTSTVKSGVLMMQNVENCIHDYQQMVSCAQNHWLKCTKCYKVIKSEFIIGCESQNGSRVIKILGSLNSNVTSIIIPNQIGGLSVTSIGAEAFKGCANLESIIMPNTITNIDSSAFEGCSYLQSVTLSTNLIAIGSSVFKGCASLESITIPSSVQYIDNEAFKNCSSLTLVTVNRRITNITNLGVSVFDGCNASLKIIVPANRIAEYKNKEYWSSYRNKIITSEDYTEYEIDCEGNVTESLSLSKATNELYKLNVNCSKSYKINANSSNIVNIIIYDANMNVISSGSNTVTQFLGCGTYYISFEFDDTNASGTFEIGISLTWTSSNILLNKGTNNIKNSMHLNNENAYNNIDHTLDYLGAKVL